MERCQKMNTGQKNKKFLMVATVPSMIGQFNMDNIRILQEMGYEVHVACNFKDYSVWTRERIEKFRGDLANLKVKEVQVEFARTPYDISKLLQAYKKLRKLIKGQKYEGLHCHTPVAGMVTRLAAIHTKTKVIYTAHGFHFFKGAPLKNWLIYYPVEKICSYMTDVLITINKEDYALAKKKMAAKRVEYVPGVGIDLDKFKQCTLDRTKKRKMINVSENDIMLLSIGELSVRKNHKIVLDAIAELGDEKIKYCICGTGEEKGNLIRYSYELGIQDQLILLGFRTDIVELCNISDLFVFPSIQEGLPVALMESIACKVPSICSRIRGNIDLINDDNYLFNPLNTEEVMKKIAFSLNNKKNNEVVEGNYLRLKRCSIDKIRLEMKKIYSMIDG